MFHKPFRVKSQSAIRSSDRKKLRAEIKSQFVDLTEDELRDLVPNKEEMSVMKIFTHSEDNVMVYVLKKNPIFFEVDRVVYPTVYTLWKFPDLLPVFTTWAPVIQRLQKGADLMLPGVIVKGPVTPETFKHLDKGTPASVNLLPNKAPIAIGKTAMSGSDMYLSAMRGKGVMLYHVYKDQLWAHGDKSNPPELGGAIQVDENVTDGGLESGLKEDAESSGTTLNGGGADIKVEEADVALPGASAVDSVIEETTRHLSTLSLENNVSETPDDDIISLESGAMCAGAGAGGACGNGAAEDMSDIQGEAEAAYVEEPLSETEQMDKLLYDSLLHSLKATIKKTDYPILTSKLFRLHMVPCCRGKDLDLKKSSYKKLSKFLQEMEKRNLLGVKELSKGVESVTAVNRAHPDLRSFTVPDLPEEEEDDEPDDEKPYVPPEIVDMFGVSAAVLPLFSLVGYKKGSALMLSDVRKAITGYVKDEELKDQENKGKVILDPVLTDVLFRSEGATSVRYDELIKRCLEKMSPMHQMTYPGEKPVVKKGKVEPVTFMIAQRGGNKKVTLIENLEQFGISPKQFAHEVQIGVACSTSVSSLPGKAQGMQVLVQGNQINFVAELLADKYQLNKKYLQGLEKAPKGKKKR
ncbi:eukaryotic translation initiation factor 2D-like [Lineus longissimus]|uniref:eukaryotic translation initiation factor 2D-like n=1 Tax=Lineus longissimus TaxID=88925 RepID=UPI002B4EE1AD